MRVRGLVGAALPGVDGTRWCNASGPSNEPTIALCSDFSEEGSTYVATAEKGGEVPQVWNFDFVVGLTSEQQVLLAPCSALRARWSSHARGDGAPTLGG